MIIYNQPEAALTINQPDEFYKLSTNEQTTLRSWVKTHITPRKTINRRYTSYGLKHDFEDDKEHGGFYVSNGAFKGAMRVCGFEADNENETNWNYCISDKSRFVMERKGRGWP